MTEVNVPLLRKTYEQIAHHPEGWDQTVWMMGNALDVVSQLEKAEPFSAPLQGPTGSCRERRNWYEIQGDVLCNSKSCFAGTTCTLLGDNPVLDQWEAESVTKQHYNSYDTVRFNYVRTPEGEVWTVQDRAAAAIGVPTDRYNRIQLFSYSNSMSTIRHRLKELGLEV